MLALPTPSGGTGGPTTKLPVPFGCSLKKPQPFGVAGLTTTVETEDVAVAVGVEVLVGVAVFVAVEVGVGVSVAVAVFVAVAVSVSVGVAVEAGLHVAVPLTSRPDGLFPAWLVTVARRM